MNTQTMKHTPTSVANDCYRSAGIAITDSDESLLKLAADYLNGERTCDRYDAMPERARYLAAIAAKFNEA